MPQDPHQQPDPSRAGDTSTQQEPLLEEGKETKPSREKQFKERIAIGQFFDSKRKEVADRLRKEMSYSMEDALQDAARKALEEPLRASEFFEKVVAQFRDKSRREYSRAAKCVSVENTELFDKEDSEKLFRLVEAQTVIKKVLDECNAHQRQIWNEVCVDEEIQANVAKKHQISPSRVNQVVGRVNEKIKNKIGESK